MKELEHLRERKLSDHENIVCTTLILLSDACILHKHTTCMTSKVYGHT